MSERALFGVPRIPDGMLTRPVLRDRIGRTPLTVVRGPGGSGKTVLLSQWAAAGTAPGVWITVEPDRSDRLAFWSAVAEAGAHAGLELRMPPPPAERADPGAIRPALVRAFRAHARRFALVVDDAHELRDPLVLEDLLEILHACPEVVVAVGTRTQSALEAPSRALTLDIAVIAPDDLTFSAGDIEQLAGDGAERATELLEASGGNALLLRAILASGAQGSASAVVRDLLTATLDRQAPELAAFASAVAIPDDVDAALAEQLSGADAQEASAMLAALESGGLLVGRQDPEGPRYRLHPLVRDELRDDLRRRYPERHRRLSLVASAAAEAQGRYLPALRHAVDAEDYARASDICLHGGLTLLRATGAGAILQRVPLRYVARLPFIAIVLALTANARGERWKALELMTLALGASRVSRGRQRAAERVGLALIESVVLRITGRAADSVVAARRMSTLLDEAPPAELEEIADQIDGYRLQGALSLFRGGALSAARVAAERAGSSAFALSSGRPEALGAASVVGAVQAILGECRDADQTLARIDASDYPDTLRDGYVGSLSHLARGILALERNDPDAAERAVGLLRDHDNIEHGMLFTVLGALAWLWRGQPQIGLQLLDEREAVDRPRDRTSEEDRRALAAGRMLLHSALGEYGAARGALRAFERNDPVAGVLEASVLLLEQRPDLVVERLGRIRDLPGPRLQAAADLLVACAAQVAGDDGVTQTAMRRFLAVVAVHDVVSPFVLIPAEHRTALLALAERTGADAATLARLRDLPGPFRATGTRVALTGREAQVLEKLSTNASQADIARALSVSTNTVKSQVRSLYRKLGASQRDEALRAAYLQGLLEGPAPRRDDPARRPPNEG